MKKISLILAMMMIVLSAMADGPTYSFMKGGQGKSRTATINNLNDVYRETEMSRRGVSARTATINYDEVNKIQTPGKSIYTYQLGEEPSNRGVSGGVSTSNGITIGRTGTSTVSNRGTALSTTLDSRVRSGNDITLGQNGHLALFGNDLPIMDGNDGEGGINDDAAGEPVRPPLGDAMLPLLMMILSFAGFVYFRKK